MTYIRSKLYKDIDTIRLLHICILLFVQKQYVTMNFIMGLLECFVRICKPDMFTSHHFYAMCIRALSIFNLCNF